MTNRCKFAAVLGVSTILAFGSCTYVKRPSFDDLAVALNVTKFEGERHPLLVISNGFPIKNKSNVNIYIEGDGRPWLSPRIISADPTPTYPLVLHLMSLDTGPAIYLSRPCHYIKDDGNCHTELWTSGRYSQEVVDAMVEALKATRADWPSSVNLTLVGYSGGATLALIIAAQLEGIDRVVTVAGNLDTDAWIAHHNYSPLINSINPAELNLPGTTHYLHLAGTKDKNIPPALGKKVYSQQGHVLKELSDFDHQCCWAEYWPQLLPEISN